LSGGSISFSFIFKITTLKVNTEHAGINDIGDVDRSVKLKKKNVPDDFHLMSQSTF
jgi:hypothetical protein